MIKIIQVVLDSGDKDWRAGIICNYLKQRIEESLAIIEEKYNARPMSDDLKLSDVIKEFEWIL